MQIQIKHIVILLLLIIISFIIGRYSYTPKKEIEYVKGDPIKDSIFIDRPIKETVPGDPIYITKIDTLIKDTIIYINQSIDTTAIIYDWIKKRSYETVLFNIDTIGKMTVYADVQYNKLISLKYDYEPVYKNVITYKEKVFAPFILGGINSFYRPEIEIGTYIKNFGISGSLSHDKNNFIYSVKFGYIFR